MRGDSGDCDSDRALVRQWAGQHAELLCWGRPRALVQAAMHAVLAGLRRYRTPGELLAGYDLTDQADGALIRSLLPDAPEALIRQVRHAALHLRWAELSGATP